MFIAIARILWAFDLSVPEGYELDVAQETAFVGESYLCTSICGWLT